MRIKQETTSTLALDPHKRWYAVYRKAPGMVHVQNIVALFEGNAAALAWAEEVFDDGLWGLDVIYLTRATLVT